MLVVQCVWGVEVFRGWGGVAHGLSRGKSSGRGEFLDYWGGVGEDEGD